MKKTLSFEKDLTFQTRLGEVTTITLENDLKFVDENNIEGNFYVSGQYKMTEATTLLEDFSFSIPVSISMVESCILDDSNINIDNFTYEIINDSILRCKIDASIDIEEKEVKEEVEDNRECDDDIIPDDLKELPIRDDRNNEKEIIQKEEVEVLENDNKTNKVNSLFLNLNDNSESFSTYSVYIMRENDTIEKVMDKYKVSLEDLKNYNDLNNIEINSKIVVPSCNKENE